MREHRATSSLQLSCPAKVNLALSVGPPDGEGFHPIASWMVAVAFGDRLTIAPLPAPDELSRFHIAFDTDAPVACEVDWPLDKDLAFRAHHLMEAHVGRSLGIKATLNKRIPAGAGLGGGSTNAAGMLVGLNRLFDLNLSVERLMQLSRQLGSDVAFAVAAMSGTNSALAGGRGEQIEPAPLTEPLHLVLIFPPFGCPTAPVYRTLDEQRRGKNVAHLPDRARVVALMKMHPLPPDAPFNDLAEPACTVRPALRQRLDELQSALAIPVHVTGSGSTMFVIAPSASAAQALARKVTALTGLPARATRTM